MAKKRRTSEGDSWRGRLLLIKRDPRDFKFADTFIVGSHPRPWEKFDELCHDARRAAEQLRKAGCRKRCVVKIIDLKKLRVVRKY